ncbi:MAG: InlB B-repeat-containing protein [Deferribacteraceae bacterium]|jgi:uncharacterized repeat protein (TIGR02543 family)|nr:InlB B-repeat-containing protein [Deferribacteraceae bacterium]
MMLRKLLVLMISAICMLLVACDGGSSDGDSNDDGGTPPLTTIHTVTFNVDGEIYSTINVVKGKSLGEEMPNDPQKDTYLFVGWNTDQHAADSNFTSNTTVNDNITVYAIWQTINIPLPTYDVQFEVNGGSLVPDQNDTRLIETEPVTTREGYTFEGWFESISFEGNRLTFPYEVTKDIMLYANWEMEPATGYTVIFLTDGTPVETMYGVTIIEELPITTREGYTFAYWFDNEIRQQATFPYTVTKNTTLNSFWTMTPRTVIFNTDGGTPVETMENVANIETEPVTTKAGYTFEGWFDNEERTGDRLIFPYKKPGDITLYAKWEIEPSTGYTVTFYPNYGDEEPVVLTNVSYIETPPIFERENYKISYWSDGIDLKYYTFPLTVTKELHIYARWEEIPITPTGYDVTFYIDEATVLEIVTNVTQIETPPVVAIDNFKFLGWYDLDAKKYVTFPLPVGRDMRLCAQWEWEIIPENIE